MLRILIFSDDPLARSGLAAMLATQPAVTVLAQAATDADVAQTLDVYAPDAILWDAVADAATARERIAELDGRIPVLGLTQDVRDARIVWGGNVRGILPRGASGGQIVSALQSIATGLLVLDPSFSSFLSPARTDGDAEPAESLTPREVQVLNLIARGLANKNIAQELGISEHTVKFHVNSILAKLGAASRTDAVVRATRLGLITL